MELNMNLRQAQTQTLSPQMLQSMEILQMGSQELLEYIEETVQENPVLEMDERSGSRDSFELTRRKLEWLESTDVQNRSYYQQDSDEDTDPLANYGGVDDNDGDLYRYVFSQLHTLALDGFLLAAADFVVESLDQNGWLDEDDAALAEAHGCDKALMAQAVEVVQGLEPAGVAARNLQECLKLQLARRGEEDGLAWEIVEGYLDALAKNRLNLIAKDLKADIDEVLEAKDLIRSLNPRPATGFSAREHLTYINPDIIVVSFPDHFELLTNDYFFPSLHMNSYYQGLLKESGDAEVREYLSEKLNQAKWVVRSIEQRRSTLMDCASCILRRQEPFFRRGAGHLAPMSLSDIAGELGVHESTVSRAVKDKYMQCSMGVYPLSYFFSRSLGAPAPAGGHGNAASPDFAKALLKRLVAEEDKRKPLSDQKLCEQMEREGCAIARRTVAKYRDELNIPGTTGRKTYE